MSLVEFIMDCICHPERSIFELIFTDNTQDVAVTCLGVFSLLETNLTNPVQRVRYPLMPSLTMLDKIFGSL
jgi:hypothetical protein